MNRPFIVSQGFVMRKLSPMYPTICSNFFIGMTMLRVSTRTQGRADGLNIPGTIPGSSGLLLKPGIKDDR